MNRQGLSADMQLLPYSSEKIAELLDRTPWSRVFSWQQLLVLAQHLRPYAVASGTTLFSEGDPGGSMGILIKGSIDVFKSSQLIATLRCGRTYGEMSLIDRQPRSAEAVVHEDAELAIIDSLLFVGLMNNHPRIALNLVMTIAYFLSQSLRKTSGDFSEMLAHADEHGKH